MATTSTLKSRRSATVTVSNVSEEHEKNPRPSPPLSSLHSSHQKRQSDGTSSAWCFTWTRRRKRRIQKLQQQPHQQGHQQWRSIVLPFLAVATLLLSILNHFRHINLVFKHSTSNGAEEYMMTQKSVDLVSSSLRSMMKNPVLMSSSSWITNEVEALLKTKKEELLTPMLPDGISNYTTHIVLELYNRQQDRRRVHPSSWPLMDVAIIEKPGWVVDEFSRVFPQSTVHSLFRHRPQKGLAKSSIHIGTLMNTIHDSVTTLARNGTTRISDDDTAGADSAISSSHDHFIIQEHLRLFSLVIDGTGGDITTTTATAIRNQKGPIWNTWQAFAPLMMPHSLYIMEGCGANHEHEGQVIVPKETCEAFRNTLLTITNETMNDASSTNTSIMMTGGVDDVSYRSSHQHPAVTKEVIVADQPSKSLWVKPSADSFWARIALAQTFPQWCFSTLPGFRLAPFLDKHAMKDWVPRVRPRLRVAREYAFVDHATNITSALLESIRATSEATSVEGTSSVDYIMKATHLHRHGAIAKVTNGNRVQCHGSACQPQENGESLTEYLQRLCGIFLSLRSSGKNHTPPTAFDRVPRRCVFEESLPMAGTTLLRDIRFHIFHGHIKFISIDQHAEGYNTTSTPVSLDWEELLYADEELERPAHPGLKPTRLKQMMEDALALYHAVNGTLFNQTNRGSDAVASHLARMNDGGGDGGGTTMNGDSVSSRTNSFVAAHLARLNGGISHPIADQQESVARGQSQFMNGRERDSAMRRRLVSIDDEQDTSDEKRYRWRQRVSSLQFVRVDFFEFNGSYAFAEFKFHHEGCEMYRRREMANKFYGFLATHPHLNVPNEFLNDLFE